MGKYELLPDRLLPAVGLNKELSVFVHHGLELGPVCTADEAPFLPRVARGGIRRRVVSSDLLIEEQSALLDIAHPAIPVLEHRRPLILLLLKEINTVVQLTHSLGNLLRCGRVPEQLRCQRFSVEILLESTIRESSQKPWSDSLPCKTLEDGQLSVPVNQILNVRAVDTE